MVALKRTLALCGGVGTVLTRNVKVDASLWKKRVKISENKFNE